MSNRGRGQGTDIRHVCPQYPLGWVPFGPKIHAVSKGTEITFFLIFPRNFLKKGHIEPKSRHFRIFLQNILRADVAKCEYQDEMCILLILDSIFNVNLNFH